MRTKEGVVGPRVPRGPSAQRPRLRDLHPMAVGADARERCLVAAQALVAWLSPTWSLTLQHRYEPAKVATRFTRLCEYGQTGAWPWLESPESIAALAIGVVPLEGKLGKDPEDVLALVLIAVEARFKLSRGEAIEGYALACLASVQSSLVYQAFPGKRKTSAREAIRWLDKRGIAIVQETP